MSLSFTEIDRRMRSIAHSRGFFLELIWRNPSGATQRKTISWRGPVTDDDLAAYLQQYFERLDSGYRPAGVESPPRPHCARIHHLGRVVAEWIQKLSPGPPAESLVTADAGPGRGGIPANPDAHVFVVTGGPNTTGPVRDNTDSGRTCGDPLNVARLDLRESTQRE